MSEPDCIFCKIAAGELPAQIVDEDERTIAFMDINPATRGHLLVIPRRHSRDLEEIDPEDLAAVALTAQRMARDDDRAAAHGRSQMRTTAVVTDEELAALEYRTNFAQSCTAHDNCRFF